MKESLPRFAIVAPIVLAFGAGSSARAEDGRLDAGAVDAAAERASDAAADPAVVVLERDARDVRALIAGQLDPAMVPGSLFEIALAERRTSGSTPRASGPFSARSVERRVRARPRLARAHGRPMAAPRTRASISSLGTRESAWIAQGSRSTSYRPSAARSVSPPTRSVRQTARRPARRRSAGSAMRKTSGKRRCEPLRSAGTDAERLVATELARSHELTQNRAAAAGSGTLFG